jgi:hypothetical protein
MDCHLLCVYIEIPETFLGSVVFIESVNFPFMYRVTKK